MSRPRVLPGRPAAVLAARTDEYAAVVVPRDDLARCFARVGAPVEGVAFGRFVHAEGGGLVGRGGDAGAGGVEGGEVQGEVPDVDVAGFGEGGGERGVGGGADAVGGGGEGEGAGLEDGVVFGVGFVVFVVVVGFGCGLLVEFWVIEVVI